MPGSTWKDTDQITQLANINIELLQTLVELQTGNTEQGN